MDKQAIVERVAKSCEAEASKGLIANVLEDAGFFELLEAAEFYYQKCNPSRGAWTQIGECKNCGTRIPTISWELCDKCAWDQLDVAIKKVEGEV